MTKRSGHLHQEQTRYTPYEWALWMPIECSGRGRSPYLNLPLLSTIEIGA
jgi:hypothetical protein